MRSTSFTKAGPQAWLRLGLGLAALLALLQALGAFDAGRLQRSLPDLCLFHRLTGWQCPGCGMTRAIVSLSRGDWRGAWDLNPWSLPLLGAAVVGACLPPAWSASLARQRWAQRLGWAAVAALLAWWLWTRVWPHFR